MSVVEKNKKRNYIAYSAFFSLLFLIFPFACHAALENVVNGVLGFMAGVVVKMLGAVSSLAIDGIVSVAKYNNFINETSIKEAWAIVRDISNMFFILILLLIAFATILRIETYNMKRWLPKLLIMAVLINFSKTICGIMIDFSQVIMLTFVNTFATNGGQFFKVLELKNMISSSIDAGLKESGTAGAMTISDIVVAYLLACIFMLVAAIALLAILITIVMRVIMFWILIALSPLAFMLSTFPQGQRYASQYWGEFTRYLVNGPVLAFFIWLSLSVMNNFESNGMFGAIKSSGGLVAGTTSILTSNYFISFVMAIGFLVGGLMISQQIGGIGASWGMSTVRNLGNKGLNMTKGAAKGAAKGTVAGLDWVNRKQAAKTGVDLNMSRNFEKVKASFKRTKDNDLRKAETAATANLAKGGMTGLLTGFSSSDWGDNYISGFMGYRGMRQAFSGGQKKVKRLTDEAKEYEKMKDAVGDKRKYEKRMEELTKERSTAEADGDTKKAAEIKKTIAAWESNKDKILDPKKEGALKKFNDRITSLDNQKNLIMAGKVGKQAESDKKIKDLHYQRHFYEQRGDDEEVERIEEEIKLEEERKATIVPNADKEVKRIEEEVSKIKKEREAFSAKAFPGEQDAARSYFGGKAKELSKSAEEITVSKFYGQVADKEIINNEAKKVTSGNEDELITQFGVAVANNNAALAAAIAKAMAKNGNINALLNREGYNTKAGLTEKEAQRAMKNGTYNQFRGVNDFMRDVFRDKLGMNEQSVFGLQSDLSSIAEDAGHNYLMSTVGYDRTGNFYQREANERNEIKSYDNSKKESEGKVRKLNRFGWGDEDVNGNFTWDPAGLADFINNVGLIDKEIQNRRFNKNAAAKISDSASAMKQLNKTLQQIYDKNRDGEGRILVPGKDKDIPLDEFMAKLANYGSSASRKNRDRILHIKIEDSENEDSDEDSDD